MDYSYYYDAAKHALDKHHAELSSAHMEWLKGLPYQHAVEGCNLQLCHGSPVRLEEFEYVFSPEQARECLSIWDDLPALTLIGHSHLCKVFEMTKDSVTELPAVDFTLREGRKYIASVGSVGQPRDYDNRASYAIYDSDATQLCFRRVEYDIEGAAEKIFSAGLEENFGHRLFLGI